MNSNDNNYSENSNDNSEISNDNNYSENSENSDYPLSKEATDLALRYPRGKHFLNYVLTKFIPRMLASDPKRFPLRGDYSDKDKNIVNTAWGQYIHEYKVF